MICKFPPLLLGVTAALALGACTGTPTLQSGPDAETIDGRLYRVDGAAQDLVYVDPTADFSRYRRVLLRPLNLDSVEIIQPGSSGSFRRKGTWTLTDEDRDILRSAYRGAMVREFEERGGYALAEAPADDVLEIIGAVTQVAPKTWREDQRPGFSGRSQVYTEGAGSLSVAVSFRDAGSGEVLALSKDRRQSASHWGLNNRVSNLAEVRRVFAGWAAQLRRGLDRMRSLEQQNQEPTL